MPLTLFKEKSPTVYRYYAFTFFSGLVFYTAVLVPFYTQWGGISLTQVQILQTWFMISALLLEIPTGVVADKYGRKHSVALGSITLAVAFILYGTIPRFEMFLVCEFLFGLGYALISGAGDALLYDTLKDEDRENETKQIFGKSQSIGLASGIIATIAGSIIASQFGLNIPMILSAIPVVIAAIFIWSIKEPRYKETDAKSPNYFSLAKNGIVYLSTHKILRLLALDSILVGAAAYFLVWLYQPLLQVIAFPIFYFGFIRAGLTLAQIGVSSNFSLFEKLFGSESKFTKGSALIVTATFFLAAAFPNIITILFFVVIGGGFGTSRMTFMITNMNKHIPSDQRATIISSITMFQRLVLAVCNPIVGYIATVSLRGALVVVGVLPLLSLLFSYKEKEQS